MDTDGMLKALEEQESVLRFDSIDFKTLTRISLRICEKKKSLDKTAYILTTVNGLSVFSLAMPGATKNNEDWARRKSNLTLRYSMSSLHATLNMQRNGKTLEICGMDSRDYGLSGGSFPILLKSGVCIGSITVSGMTEWEDHQTVSDAIAEELGVEIPSILSFV